MEVIQAECDKTKLIFIACIQQQDLWETNILTLLLEHVWYRKTDLDKTICKVNIFLSSYDLQN